jgi:hypothetical protein
LASIGAPQIWSISFNQIQSSTGFVAVKMMCPLVINHGLPDNSPSSYDNWVILPIEIHEKYENPFTSNTCPSGIS